MSQKRKKYTGKFKAKVALEAIADQKTISQIASEYQIHPTLVSRWKKEALERLPQALSESQQSNHQSNQNHETEQLYQQIGKLTMENEFLKKKLNPFQ